MDNNMIFSLYGSEMPKQITLHNTSRVEDDLRMVYIVEFPNADRLAVKVTKNSFSTFCESFCYLNDDSEIDLLLDNEALKKRDEWTAKRLTWIGRHYKFTDNEREAFNEYYNMVAPFRWPYHSFFLSLLKNRERYPDGRKYAGLILDWIEHQMTRNDVSSLLP